MDWDNVLSEIQDGVNLTPEQLYERVGFLEDMLIVKEEEIEILKSYVDWEKIRAEHRTWNEQNKNL